MFRGRLAIAGIVVAVAIAGCESPGPSRSTFTPLRVKSATMAEAFAAAEETLLEQFHIEVRDPARGLLRTAAIESRERQSGAGLGDALGATRTVRKYVEVRVQPADAGVNIWCKVPIERNETDSHRMFANRDALSDSPSDSPADWSGATTTEQNTVWRPTGRDRRLEREIRRAIREKLGQS